MTLTHDTGDQHTQGTRVNGIVEQVIAGLIVAGILEGLRFWRARRSHGGDGAPPSPNTAKRSQSAPAPSFPPSAGAAPRPSPARMSPATDTPRGVMADRLSAVARLALSPFVGFICAGIMAGLMEDAGYGEITLQSATAWTLIIGWTIAFWLILSRFGPLKSR